MEIRETFPPYWPQGKQYTHDYASRCMHQINTVVDLYLSLTLISRKQIKLQVRSLKSEKGRECDRKQ